MMMTSTFVVFTIEVSASWSPHLSERYWEIALNTKSSMISVGTAATGVSTRHGKDANKPGASIQCEFKPLGSGGWDFTDFVAFLRAHDEEWVTRTSAKVTYRQGTT